MNQFGPYYRKRSRSCGPRPVSSPRQCPIRRSRSLSSLPYFNNTEGVRYEGNLRSFYNRDTSDDQRILSGTVYNDDNDLYRKLDDQWRQEYEENEQAQINKRFGYKYDNSYSVHHRYQMPLIQRTPTLRDNLCRTRANYMIHESQKPRYLRNRPQRIAQRLEDYRLWNTMHESRPLQGIQEVSPQKEKYWDYDLDELDSSF